MGTEVEVDELEGLMPDYMRDEDEARKARSKVMVRPYTKDQIAAAETFLDQHNASWPSIAKALNAKAGKAKARKTTAIRQPTTQLYDDATFKVPAPYSDPDVAKAEDALRKAKNQYTDD